MTLRETLSIIQATAASDAATNRQVRRGRTKEALADPDYAKELRRRGYLKKGLLEAEIGYPGSGSSVGNLIEPVPANNVPSLGKKKRRPITDDEEEEMERKIMPRYARRRKRYKRYYNGKIGGLQTW